MSEDSGARMPHASSLMPSKRRMLLALLAIAAGARLVMHMAALPPYAGLDEVYHVARLAFVLQEHRNPTVAEKSVPPYIEASMNEDPRALPAFCLVGVRWPEIVRSRPILAGHVLTTVDLRPYTRPNYEAQQPPLYYSLIAPIAHLLPRRTPVNELRLWRGVSVLFALVVVMATAVIGTRYGGNAGILVAALVVALPTWLTLVIRASNDAMACALVAVAIAITASAPRRPMAIFAEAICWAAALAVKLYTWPVAVVLPLFWWRQRASKTRMAVVLLFCALTVIATAIDLSHRTRNPIGNFGFDRPERAASAPARIRVLDMLKITIASGIWTSGQHNDAMRPVAMALFAVPIVAMLWWGTGALGGARRRGAGAPLSVVAIALATFALAQLVNAAAFTRQARAAGLDLPLGGKEGWYWYVLVPLVVGIVFTRARKALYAIAAWLVLWDVLIHEVALFHDFAGTSSPAHPSALFRWGPLQPPFTAGLSAIGVGPLASHLTVLRVIELAALLALFLQGSSSDDRDRSPEEALPHHPH